MQIRELEMRKQRPFFERIIESCYDFFLRQGKKTMSMSDDLKPGVLYLKVRGKLLRRDLDAYERPRCYLHI